MHAGSLLSSFPLELLLHPFSYRSGSEQNHMEIRCSGLWLSSRRGGPFSDRFLVGPSMLQRILFAHHTLPFEAFVAFAANDISVCHCRMFLDSDAVD